LRLGTLKANVGHLTAAAGAAGVIASLLAMRNEAIAPNLPLVEGAEAIDMSGSPFRLDDRVRTWKRGAEPRYAAISSFGLGGTNAHIIIGDPHETAQRGARRSWQVLPLSADDPERMSVTVAAYREAVTNATPDERHDLAHTLRMGRPELPVRTLAVVPAADTAGDSTATVAWPAAESFRTPAGQPSLIYLLPGQGGPATQAAHRLYDTEPWFAATVDEGLAIVESVTDPATVTRVREAFTTGSSTADTRIAQPVGHLTACGVATILNRLSAVRPAAIAGHSVAEITAAHLAGVMSFADATAAVCYRGAAMAAMPPGEMYAVRAEAASLTGMPAGAEVSVRNAPSASVISTMDGEALREWLAARGVEYRRLETSHAFHHTSMEPAAGQFAKWMGDMELRPPQIAVLSCPDGDWLDARRATDPLYWGRQSREPVDFVAGTARLVAEYPSAVYVQLSGGTHLLGAVREAGSATGAAAAGLAVLPGGDARMTLPAAIGGLWQHGIAIDWNAYTRGDRGKRTITPPRPLRDTPVLHPSLRGHTPGIDPADLDIPHPAPPAPAADDEETPLLDAVSQCWAETLGATPEADADFFASGGDSIAAAQIVAGLRSRFNVPIPVHLPLVVTSPRELAKAVDDLLIAAVLNN
ncbi:MAG: acyltransferase domain-containing protein, partial [Stackebrandtia sp.]